MATPVSPTTVSWLLPIAAAFIAAGSTCFGVWVTNYFAHKRLLVQLAADEGSEKRTRRREKLEGLYLEFDRWITHHSQYHFTLLDVMKGKLSYSVFYEKLFHEDERKIDVDVIYMVADLYAPELNDDLGKVVARMSELENIESDYKLKHGEGEPSSDSHSKLLKEALSEYRKAGTGYLESLAVDIRKLI